MLTFDRSRVLPTTSDDLLRTASIRSSASLRQLAAAIGAATACLSARAARVGVELLAFVRTGTAEIREDATDPAVIRRRPGHHGNAGGAEVGAIQAELVTSPHLLLAQMLGETDLYRGEAGVAGIDASSCRFREVRHGILRMVQERELVTEPKPWRCLQGQAVGRPTT